MSGGEEFAGRLAERIVLLRRAGDGDALGGPSDQWTVTGSAWAAVEPRPAGPEVIGEARDRPPRWRVTIRPRDVAIGDRIAWAGRLIEVRSLTEDPRLADRIEIETEQVR